MIQEGVECMMCGNCTYTYIKLLNTTICEACEREICMTKAEDIKYEYYNLMIKQSWRNYLVSM